MRIVTLTSDLGYRDHYLAIVKATLLSKNPEFQIIDLSCEIKNHNIADAAYILKNSLPHFPANTIHLVAIKFSQESSKSENQIGMDNSRYLVTRYKDQYILCPDAGLFSLIDAEFKESVYQLYYEGHHKNHFFLKDVFVDAALHISQNKALEEIASLTSDYYRATQFESYLTGNILKGKAIYVDSFGNIVTNITKKRFEEVVGKRSFTITFPAKRIDKIYNTYDEVKHGAALVLFNSSGYLEVAVNGGSAFNLLCPKDIGKNFDFNLLIQLND